MALFYLWREPEPPEKSINSLTFIFFSLDIGYMDPVAEVHITLLLFQKLFIDTNLSL